MLRISSTYLASGNFLCTFCKRWRRDGRKFQVMSFTRDFNQRYITSCQNTVKWSMTRFPCLSNMRKASSYAASRLDPKHGKARSGREVLSRQDNRTKAVAGAFNQSGDGNRMESHGGRVSALRRRTPGDSIARRSQKLIQQSDSQRVKDLEKYGKTVKIKSNFKILSGEDDWDDSAKEMIGRAKLKTVDGGWSRTASGKADKAFTEFQEMISVPGSTEMEQYLHEQNLRKKAKQVKKRSVNVFKVSDPYVKQRLHKNKTNAGIYNQSHLLRMDEPQCEFAEVQCGKKRVYIAYMEDALPEKVRGQKQPKPVKALQEKIMRLPPEKLKKITPEKIAKMAQKKPMRDGMIVKMVQDKPDRVMPLNLKLPKKSNDFKVFVNLKNARDDMCPLVHFEEKTPDGPVGQTMKFQVKKMEKYWFSTGHGKVRIQYLTGVLTNFRNRLKEKLEMPKLLKSPAGMTDQTKVMHYHNADEGTPAGKPSATPPTGEQKENLTQKLKLLTSNRKEPTDMKKEEEHQSMFKMMRRKGKKSDEQKKDEKKSEAPESGATKTFGSFGKLMQGVVKPKVEQGKEGPEVRSKPSGLDIPLKPAHKVKEARTLKAEVSKKTTPSEEKLLPPVKPKTVTPAWKEIEKINKEKQAEQSRIPIPVVTDPYFTQLHKQKALETSMRRGSQKVTKQGQQIQPVGVSTSHQPGQVSQEQQIQPAAVSPSYEASQSGQVSQEQQTHPVGASLPFQEPQPAQISQEQHIQPVGVSPPHQTPQLGQVSHEQPSYPIEASLPYQAPHPTQTSPEQQIHPVEVSPPYQAPQPGQIYEQQQYQMPPPELASQQEAQPTSQTSAPGWMNPPAIPQPQQQNAPPHQLQTPNPSTNDGGFLPPQTAQQEYQWNPYVQGYQDKQSQQAMHPQPVPRQEIPSQWATPHQWNPQQIPHQSQWSPPVPNYQQTQEVQLAERNTAQPEQEKQTQPPAGPEVREEKSAPTDFYYPDLGPKITKPIKKPPTAESPRRVNFSTIFRNQEAFIPIRVEVPPLFMDKGIQMYDTQKEVEETINKPIPEDDPPSYHWENWRIPSLRQIVHANSNKASFIIDSDSLGDSYAARNEYAQTAVEYNYDQEPDMLSFERAVAQNFTQVEDADLMSVKEEQKPEGEKSAHFPQEKAPAVDNKIPDGGKPDADVVTTADNRPGYLSYINQLPSYAQSAFEYFHPAEVFDTKILQNFVSYPLRMATAQWSTYHAAANVPETAPELIPDSEASRSVTFQEGVRTQSNESKAPMAFVARSTNTEAATSMTKTKSLVPETKPQASHTNPNDPYTEPEANNSEVTPSTEAKLHSSNPGSKISEPATAADLPKRGNQGVSRQPSDTTKMAQKLTDGESGGQIREELLRKLKNELTTKLKDQWNVKLFDELTDRVKPVVENKLLSEKASKQLFLEKAYSQANVKEKTPPKKQEEDDYRKKSSATPVMTFREMEHLIQPKLRSEAMLTGAGVSAMDWSQQEGFSFQLEKKVIGEPTAKLAANLKSEKSDKEDDKQKISSPNPEKVPPVPHIPEKDHPYLPRKDLPGNPQKREAEPQPRPPKVFPHHKDHPYLPKFDQPLPKRETPVQPYYPEQPYYSPGNPYQPHADPPSQPYYPFTQPNQPNQPQTNPPRQPYHPQTQPNTSPYSPQTQPPSQPQQPQTQPPCQPCQPQTLPPTQPQTQPYYPQTQPATHPNQPTTTPQPSTPIYPRQQASEADSAGKIQTDKQIFSTKESEGIQTVEQITEEWRKYFEQLNKTVEESGTIETGKQHERNQSEVHFFKDNTPTAKPEESHNSTKQFFPQQNTIDKKEEEKKNLATIRPNKTGPAQFDKYKEDFRKLKEEEEALKPAKTQELSKAGNKPMEVVAKATGDQTKGRGDSGPPKGQDQRKGGSDKEESEKRQERIEAKEAEKRKQQESVAAQAMEMRQELAAKKDRRLRDELEAKKRAELRRQPTILGYGSVVYDKPLQQATQIIQVPIDKKQEESKDKKPVKDEKQIQFPTPEKPSIKSKKEEPKPTAKAKTEEPKPSTKAKAEEPKQATEKQATKAKPEEPTPTAKQSKLLDVLLPKIPEEKKPEKVVKVGVAPEEKSKPRTSKLGSELIDFGTKAVERDKKAVMGGEAKKESDKKEKLSPVRESEWKVQGEADKLKIDEGKKDKKTAKSDSNLGKAGDDKSGRSQPTKTAAGKTSEEKAKPEEAVKRKSSLSDWEKEIASKASSIFGLGSDKSKAKKEANKSKSIKPEDTKVKNPEEKKAKTEETGKGETSGRGKFFELPRFNTKDKKGGESSGSKTPKMDAQDDSLIMEARLEQYMKMYEPPTKIDNPGSSPMMTRTPKTDLLTPKNDELGYCLTPTGTVTTAIHNSIEPMKSDSNIRIVKIIFDDTKKDVDVIVEQGKKAEVDRREEEMKSSFEMMKALLKGTETESKVIIPTAKEDQPLMQTNPYMQILEMALANEKNKMKAQQERRDTNLQSFVDLLKNTIVNAKDATEKIAMQPSGVSAENFRSFLRLFRAAIDSAESELQRRASSKTGEGDIRKTDLQSFMTILKDAIAGAGAEETASKTVRKRAPVLDHIDAVKETKTDVKSPEQKKIQKVAMGFGMTEKKRHAGERVGQIADNKETREETKITELKKPEEGFVTTGTTGKREEPMYIAPHLREVPEVSPKPKRESFMVSVPPTAERTVKEFVIREEPSDIEAVPTGDEPKPTHPGKDPEVVCIQSNIRSARVDKISMKEGKTGKYPRTILPDIPKPEKQGKPAPSLIECKTAQEPPAKPFNEEARAEELRKALTEESSESEPVSVAAGNRTKGISRRKTTGGSQQKRDLQTLATAMLKDAEGYEPNRLIMRKLLGNRERAREEEEEEKDDESPPSGDLDDALRHKIASAPYRKTELRQTEKEMSGIRDKTELKTVRVFEEPATDTHREYILAAAKKASEVPCVLPIDPDNPPEEASCLSIPPPEASPILPPEGRKSKPKFWWQK